MARYLVRKPAYVDGKYIANEATNINPLTIDLPDTLEPSLTWDPMDKAASDAYALAVEAKIEKLSFGITDKARLEQIATATRKAHKKVIVEAPAPKPSAREIGTNTEMIEQGRKVVGRASDKSPV